MTHIELLTLVRDRLTELGLFCALVGKLPNTFVMGGTGQITEPVPGFTGMTFRITVEEREPTLQEVHPSPWLKAEVDAVTEVRCPNPFELANAVHAIVRDRVVRRNAAQEMRARMVKAMDPK